MKRNILNKIILATGISISAIAVTAFGDDMDMNSTNPPSQWSLHMPLTSTDFAWDASVANLKEIRLAQAAEQNSQNARVKHFAKRMIRDHSKANEKLIKIADAEGLNLPSTNVFNMTVTPPENEKPATKLMAPLTPAAQLQAEQMNVQNLTSLSGTDFDQAYANEAVKDHIAAVELFEDATNLQDGKLKKFADKTLPVLREHYRLAEELQNKVCGMTNAPDAYRTNAPARMW